MKNKLFGANVKVDSKYKSKCCGAWRLHIIDVLDSFRYRIYNTRHLGSRGFLRQHGF